MIEGMRLCCGLLLASFALLAADPKCQDTPRAGARKLAAKRRKPLENMRLTVALNEQLELKLNAETGTERDAVELEKLFGLISNAPPLDGPGAGEVVINLPKSTRITRDGKRTQTTITLTSEQLDKILEARYGKKLIAETKARMVYVHGIRGGTATYPWGDNIVIDLRR